MKPVMKISYRPESIEDLETVSRWYVDEWGHLNSSITTDKIVEGLSSMLSSGDDFLSLLSIYEGKELVAVAELKYREHKDYPEYEHWIGGVFVKPEYRGKGYAEILIAEAKKHIAKLGITELYLQCEEDNVGLYTKYGFKALHPAIHHGTNTTIFKFSAGT